MNNNQNGVTNVTPSTKYTPNTTNQNIIYCPNCGRALTKIEDFCLNCGANIKEIKEKNEMANKIESIVENSKELTMTEMFSNKSKKIITPIIAKIKTFIHNHKKQLIIGSGCLSIVIIVIILFNTFHDFTKISWDTTNGDANVTHIQPTTLNLYVLAYDKDKKAITDITFKTENGEIESDGAQVKWKLPNESGEYTIFAIAPSGKKIEKTVKVINLEDSDDNASSLSGLIEIPEEENADNDNDGLTNNQEKALGTNIESADTDEDGLTDYYEINVTKTSPLEKDTDQDGINDGDELDLGLDPLKKDSKNDGVNDIERPLNYTIENNDLGVVLEINGKGNIASSTIDVFTNSTFTDIDGILDKVYNFYSNGIIESANVKINYTLEEISSKGLNEDNLTLYYFNDDSKELEPLPTIVDKENKQIIVTLNHFSRYVIGDKNVVVTNNKTEIMFVIDNSVSMYSESQMTEAGYKSTGAIGNDTEFKRLTLTNNMVDMFTGNYTFGVAEFSGDYVNLQEFTETKSEVKKAVNSMKSNWNSSINGTNIVSALKSGIAEFSTSNDNNHYLILLTDGKNNINSLPYNKDTIITNAQNNNVKVCVIGIGDKIDTDDLNEIAESTGCDYYNASDSSALDEIYSIIGANINYNYVDTDDDNKVDGMIIANSGFIVNKDGFSFKNFISNKSANGHCYGMSVFAMLYYKNQLPTYLPAKDNSRFYLAYFKTIDLSSNGYDLSKTYFDNKNNNLYDFKMQSDGLKIMFGELPKDYRDRIENGVWMIKKEYYEKMAKIGATFSIKDYNGEDEDFDKFQSALLNIDNDTLKNSVSKDESQLLSAIWRLFILQADSKKTFFSAEPDKAFAELSNNLSEKTPIIIDIAGNHSINAIRLIQDINDSNKFKIEVYDNNYPGETRYIEVIRSKYSKFQLNYTAWTNEYNYKFKYDQDNDGKKEDISVRLNYPEIN